jgi:hypothetical protein
LEELTNAGHFSHSQTFHNYFLKGLETASAFTKLDADMRRDKRLVSALFVALATCALTCALSGCGADDSASANASSSSNVSASLDAPSSAALPAAAIPNASSTLAANPALAYDAITQNMQASLAADSQQVAPVMRYAPGDSANSN